jgi:probable rRNA maturation factor
MTVSIVFVDEQEIRALSTDETARIEDALTRIASDHGYNAGEISVAVLDDAMIQVYNLQYLQHDWPTDVISFLLSDDDTSDSIEGQLLISRETADTVAHELPWDGDTELMLYAIHGMLHLVGYDDDQPEDLELMRQKERHYLKLMNVAQADSHPHFEERAKFGATDGSDDSNE